MSEQLDLQGMIAHMRNLFLNTKECQWRSSRNYSEHVLYEDLAYDCIAWMDNLVKVSSGYGIVLRMSRNQATDLLSDPRGALKQFRAALEWTIGEIDEAGIRSALEDIAVDAARHQYLLNLEGK